MIDLLETAAVNRRRNRNRQRNLNIRGSLSGGRGTTGPNDNNRNRKMRPLSKADFPDLDSEEIRRKIGERLTPGRKGSGGRLEDKELSLIERQRTSDNFTR